VQESAADAAALKYLDATGMSSRGLLDFFKLLQREIRITGGREHPYLSTHPLANDRIAVVSNHLALSRFANAPTAKNLVQKHSYIRAKLIGFTEPLETTLRTYPIEQKDIPARYARAIAYYRSANLEIALPQVDQLIADQPDNPYFYELKGQMLIEGGRISESLVPYERMVELAPREPLLRLALGKAQVESRQSEMLLPALDNLQAAVRMEPDMREAWRLLTVINGRLGNKGELALAQAEYRFLSGDVKAAQALAERAINILPTGAPSWLRAKDILSETKRQRNK
ncbi:MAG TPA: peptidase, partial [Rhodospirillaceae bacterium]|nr:peptidase [Rhodospirillaceae bacterium]